MPASVTAPPAWAKAARGLIFDLDGVLILSRAAHQQAFEEILAEFGIDDFHYPPFAGWRTHDVLQAVFAQHPEIHISPQQLQDCAMRKSARSKQLLAAHPPIPPQCGSILRKFAEHYRLALASSGSQSSVQAFLHQTDLAPIFRSVLSGDDVHRAKPDPEIFARSMTALALPPGQCIVVEDAVSGVTAAKAAGAHVIGMGRQESVALQNAGAALVVDSLEELADFLGVQ